MRSSTLPRPAANGACCRRTSRPTRRCSVISTLGATTGRWQTINHALLMAAREAAGREASPTAGVIDSQSVKTTEAAARGAMMQERKSRAASATSSPTRSACWSRLIVHAANIQDRDGAPPLLASDAQRLSLAAPRLRRWWLCRRQAAEGPAKTRRWTIEIIKRSDAAQGFDLLPRRWVVERTLRLAQSQSPPGQGFRGHHRERRDLALSSPVSS